MPYPGIPVGTQPQAPSQREGMILSPALQPIPACLVRQIRAGEFVEVRDLLSDNVALHYQLEAIQGPLVNTVTLGALCPRVREVPLLISWVVRYLAYVAVRTNNDTTYNLITYCCLIVREALRHGRQGLQKYDRSFCAQAAIDPSIRWNGLLPDLQAATILGQWVAGCSCCPLCQGVDHPPSQCALSLLQQPVMPPQPTVFMVLSFNNMRQAGQSRPWPICTSWNGGRCTYPGNCMFHHVCITCGQQHQVRDCKDSPHDSPFKCGLPSPGTSSARGY